jgi:hypothetical protein
VLQCIALELVATSMKRNEETMPAVQVIGARW